MQETKAIKSTANGTNEFPGVLPVSLCWLKIYCGRDTGATESCKLQLIAIRLDY